MHRYFQRIVPLNCNTTQLNWTELNKESQIQHTVTRPHTKTHITHDPHNRTMWYVHITHARIIRFSYHSFVCWFVWLSLACLLTRSLVPNCIHVEKHFIRIKVTTQSKIFALFIPTQIHTYIYTHTHPTLVSVLGTRNLCSNEILFPCRCCYFYRVPCSVLSYMCDFHRFSLNFMSLSLWGSVRPKIFSTSTG